MTLGASGDTWGISGPSFLGIYVTLVVAAVIATAVIRSVRSRGPVEAGFLNLPPDQIAFLNGGALLAAYTALGGLRRAGAIGANPDRTLVPTGLCRPVRHRSTPRSTTRPASACGPAS